MDKFWKFLKANIIWCCLGCIVYWGIPHLTVTLLGIFVNRWYFTAYPALFGIQVMLPAIPIIIGISLGIKGIFLIFHKKK